MAVVLCYGDSNTHGADAATDGRHPRHVRWPGVLQRELGEGVHVIEEGLNGRTTQWDDPFLDGRNGRAYLLPCLRSHAPIDLVVIMLGTNDTKSVFGRTAAEIASGAGHLVELVRLSGTGPDGGSPAVLLVAPPPIGEIGDDAELWGFGDAAAKAAEFPRLYANVARMKGAAFLDAGAFVRPDPTDGIHLDAAAHAALGRAIAEAVRPLLP